MEASNDASKIEGSARRAMSGMQVLAGYMEGEDWEWELVFNTDSYVVSGENREGVTSCVAGYYVD